MHRPGTHAHRQRRRQKRRARPRRLGGAAAAGEQGARELAREQLSSAGAAPPLLGLFTSPPHPAAARPCLVHLLFTLHPAEQRSKVRCGLAPDLLDFYFFDLLHHGTGMDPSRGPPAPRRGARLPLRHGRDLVRPPPIASSRAHGLVLAGRHQAPWRNHDIQFGLICSTLLY